MNVTVRRNGMALIALAAFVWTAALMPAGNVAAQGTSGPTAQPWDDRVKRFYGRSSQPDRELERAKRRLYGDPLHEKMGVPENRLDRRQAPDDAASTAPPTFDPSVRRLDRDRDGAVSREEYFQGRRRMVTPGFRGERRARRFQDRLDSQFRNADRNRDGKVTPEELQGNRRF